MSEARLKSELWVKAQLRLCDINLIPAVVSRRGDADAGQVLVKVVKSRTQCELLARRFDDDGNRAWTVVIDGLESDCDAYIEREADIDPDLWVLEVEDPQGRYLPDETQPLRPL